MLGEKPLADTMANARRDGRGGAGAGKLYAVIQNRRYDPNIRRLRAFLGSGAIGEITTVNSDFYIGAHFGGFRDRMEHVLLLDMAIHTFDAARLISGADPVAVYCQRMEPGRLLVRSRRLGRGDLRDDRRDRLHLSRQLVRRGAEHDVGERVAHHRHEGSVTWDGATGFQAQAVAETRRFLLENAGCRGARLHPAQGSAATAA